MDLITRTLEFIRKHQLVSPRSKLIVGVSGGADSMSLLSVLLALRHELGIQLHAAHFNHRLRPDSDKDEEFLKVWCRKLNVPLIVGRRSGGTIKHLSEDDARQMRFDFFLKTAKKLQVKTVALAHTHNDLAETVLMRIIRGSGLYGLRAILPQRDIEGLSLIRPLICINRREIESYLKKNKIPFRTDSTNKQKIYERNKIRLQLLPLLAKQYNPQITTALSDLALTAGDDYEFLSLQARKQYKKMARLAKNSVKIDVARLKKEHPAIKRLILRMMVESLTDNLSALSFEHISAIEKLIGQKEDGRFDLPDGLVIYKNGKYLEMRYV